MRMKLLTLCISLVMLLSAGCSAAGASDSNRGAYVTGAGYVYQPEEIHIESLVAKEDYDYPLPESSPVGVTTDVDVRGNTGYIQVGLKSQKDDFEDIEPMNICFVIDISGSMSEMDKLSWVKDAFYIFINNVREVDIVSVVIFDDKVELYIPPMSVRSQFDRDEFSRRVRMLYPRGSTDILKGVMMGYSQVEQNFQEGYINRVLLLTDGMHNGTGTTDDILNIVSRYNSQDINISTIALGASADINLMVDMGIKGGGSSRFISDYVEMEEAFGSELDRLVVPSARMLDMKLTLAEGVRLKETWGYSNWVDGNTIHYSLDTIHNGDYETIFAMTDFAEIPEAGSKIAEFTLSYTRLDGTVYESEPYIITVSDDSLADLNNITNRRIKRAEGYVAYGKALIEIGELSNEIISLQNNYQPTYYQPSYDPTIRDRLVGYLREGLSMIESITRYLEDINAYLGYEGYSGFGYGDELETLLNYENSYDQLYDELTVRNNIFD